MSAARVVAAASPSPRLVPASGLELAERVARGRAVASSAAARPRRSLLNVTIPTWTPFGSRSTNVRIAATVAARRVGRTSVAAIEPETSTRSTTACVFGAAAARPPPVLAPRTSDAAAEHAVRGGADRERGEGERERAQPPPPAVRARLLEERLRLLLARRAAAAR